MAQVLRRCAASGEITAQLEKRALAALAKLDAVRYTHGLLLPLIWRLRDNLTANDAALVALAAALDAPLPALDAALVILDTRKARAMTPETSGQQITVDPIIGHQ